MGEGGAGGGGASAYMLMYRSAASAGPSSLPRVPAELRVRVAAEIAAATPIPPPIGPAPPPPPIPPIPPGPLGVADGGVHGGVARGLASPQSCWELGAPAAADVTTGEFDLEVAEIADLVGDSPALIHPTGCESTTTETPTANAVAVESWPPERAGSTCVPSNDDPLPVDGDGVCAAAPAPAVPPTVWKAPVRAERGLTIRPTRR